MAHNKILDWACSYKGGSSTFSYRIGVADGLVAMANRGKKIELAMAIKKELDMIAAKEREEAMERERELERLRNMPSLAVDPAESDDESQDEGPGFLDINDMSDQPFSSLDSREHGNLNSGEGMADFDEYDENVIDLTGDVDDNIDKIIKREPLETLGFNSTPAALIKQESSIENPSSLVRFRVISVQVVDDYLKERNIKLKMRKSRHVVSRDSPAYREGWKDSSKIDFRQRRLE
ncbi:hypothetical protein CA14_001636 [Aspergillus flavus]|uniref:Uncharacterized protein n=1 Tax=Aspergillus flavus TaxID=5059 RepID=A0AB74C2I6_ASPFL|nr:hypothetical protein CA14_001636 [Aspergillus flavus]